ncbi:hypothetical protein FisN_33Lh011 [Fistulifera solaris]|uniref:CBM6 domain-containing protein n=1 Tax=Fistulifera solaris TaxID=1519565 RepID=A0A1Z5KA31_FISSO|nr:hypothetical protein FisN_33Lh011 [Fistulifera solaris]|eukprot:GAX23123.1 hypothetical protein FisN_33Lh011 [Fistulifera solaris]
MMMMKKRSIRPCSRILALPLFLIILSLSSHNATSVQTRGSNMWYLMNSHNSSNIFIIHGTDYISMYGVDTVEGADYVGSLDADDWLRYDVHIPVAGWYVMELNVFSPFGAGSFVVGNAETRTKYATIFSIPSVGNNNRWQAIRVTVELPTGDVPLEIRSLQGGWNLKDFSFQPLDPTRSENEFGKTTVNAPMFAPAIPTETTTIPPNYFTMIAADNFVLLHGAELQTSSEGLENIGWLDPSDYVIYNIQLPYSETYDFKARISSPEGQGAFQIMNNETMQIYAKISSFPKTGDWQIWETISNVVQFPGGALTLRLVPVQEGWNMLWLSFELLEIKTSANPSQAPSDRPTTLATPVPTGTPTRSPVSKPSARPTLLPTLSPTTTRLAQPTRAPVRPPTWAPREQAAPVVSRSEVQQQQQQRDKEMTQSSPVRSDSNPDTWFWT